MSCYGLMWIQWIYRYITFGYCYMTHTLRGYVGFGVFHGGSLESYRIPGPCGPTLYTRTVRIKTPFYVAFVYYKFVKVKCLSADLWAIMMLRGLFFRINVPNTMFTSPLHYRGNFKTFWILVLTTKKPTAFNNETQLWYSRLFPWFLPPVSLVALA